jgi:hypothetical protein
VKPRTTAGLLALALLGAAPARAETKFFPLPMYTTVPNEGSTYGFMPVFLGVASDATIQSITAPSLSWNTSAGITATYRYYRIFGPLGSWHFIVAASTRVNRNLWFQYDDNRRDPQASTKNINLRVRRNLFYRFFGLGPDTTPAGESSYTRLTAVAYGRWGYNFTRNFNVGPFLQVQGDKPEVHAISGLPETQVVYPDAPGLGGSAFARQGLSVRYDTREGREYALSGFATELSGSLAEGISGVGLFGELLWNTEILVPETSFLRLGGRLYVRQVVGSNIPFYDQASLGGELLLRGYPEDRFIDMGAWEAETEQRLRLLETHIFGVDTEWRIDPFFAVGQVYGTEPPWSHVRVAGGVGLRAWIKPDILGRVDLAYSSEGLRAYVVLGYPY